MTASWRNWSSCDRSWAGFWADGHRQQGDAREQGSSLFQVHRLTNQGPNLLQSVDYRFAWLDAAVCNQRCTVLFEIPVAAAKDRAVH